MPKKIYNINIETAINVIIDEKIKPYPIILYVSLSKFFNSKNIFFIKNFIPFLLRSKGTHSYERFAISFNLNFIPFLLNSKCIYENMYSKLINPFLRYNII